MEEDGDLTELASAFGVKIDTPKKQPQGRGDDSVARVLDDEFSKLGYPATARTSILGDVGRENSWDRNTIFQGHPDPKNGAYNRGIISWQGDRQKALTDELKRQGVYGRGDDEELRGMARFMDSEMRSKYPDVYQQLRNPKTTAQASEALRRYINYVPTAPYNTPDPEFGVKNNREWALRAKELGLGNDPKPLDSLLEAFTGDNSSSLDSLDNAFAPNQQPDGQRPPTSAPLGPTDPTQAMQQPQAALPQDEPLPVQRQRMLDLSKKTNEELQRAKTPARRNILIKRLKDYNGMIGKLDQQIRAQANVPAPQTQEPSPEYTKPDANQPGQHWSFEASGKASYEKENDLNYLGVSNGKHYAKNSDGDTFEFDEASRQFKPTSPLRSKLKFEGGRTLTKKADNVYTDDQGDDYAVTATKGEDGSYSYDTKPVQPFTKQIRLEDGSELTRGEAIATGGYRYKDQDGVEYVYDKKGIRAAKPVNWITDKAPAKLPLEKDSRFDEQKKSDYNQLLNQYSLADTSARRQRFLTGQPLSKAEIAVLKNPEGAKVLSSRTEGDRQQQQGQPSTRVIRRPATEAEYDFVRKGGMMIPMSKDGPAQFLDYDKADQDGLDKGEYRLKDDQGHSLLYKPSTGEIQNEDEVNRNVAYQVPVQLASSGMDRSTAAVNQAGQVANAISEKIDVPAGDIIDFYKVNGFSDWKSGKDLPAERFYQSANFDPVTGLATESVDGKTPSTDTVYVTERDVQRMKNFSELKKRTESEYQAKVATYKNAGQSDYIAQLRASADVGRANKAQAQAEIDAYNAALNQLPTEANYTKSLFADAKIGDPNALKPQSISNEEFLAYKIRKYGSITRMNQIKAAADALPIGDRIIEAGKDIAGIIPKMIGQVLKTAGSASAVVSRLSSGRFGGLMETQTDKTWLYQIGDAYEWVPDYVLPPDQLARESAIVSAADGIGQVGALIALTYVSGGQTLANVVGLSQGYASQYDEAKQAGRPENERLLIGVVGALAAMPDVWLRAKWFKGLTDPEKQVFMRKALAPIVSQLNERVGEVEARNIFGKGLAALYARAKSLGIKLAAPGEEEIVHPLTTWGAIKMVAAGTQFEGAQEVSEDKINDTAAKLVYNPNIQWSDILSLEDKNISSYIGGAFGGLGGAGAEIVGHPDAFRSYKERSEAYRALDEAFNVDGIEYKNGKKQFKLGSETFDITPEIEAELQKYNQNRKEIHNDEKQLVKLIQSARSAKTFAERKGILKDVKLASENLKELHEQKSDSVTKIYDMAGVADRIENTLGKPGDGKSETEVNTDKAARNMWNQVVSGLQENQDGIGMIPTPAETPTSAAPESATAAPEPEPEKPAQAATPSTLTDKDGKQYEVLDDQGDQIKVQEVKPDGTKGSITRKPVRKFTNVEEFRQSQNDQPETTVSEPSAPVGEEPLVQDQGTTSPIKAENVTQPATNVKETPESKPKGPITLQGIQLKPQDGRPPQKFSNTQIQFNKEQSAPIEEFRNKVIDKADVAATEDLPSYANDGLKIDPHVTVKYGLHTNDAEDVSSLFKGEKPITLTLGKTAVFPGAEGGNYDVVIAEVDSPDLHALNKKVTNNAKVTETHPEYKPHVTIAYVKKGMGKKYAGRTDFEGQKYTFDGVTFSPADKSGKVQIPFKAQDGAKTTPKYEFASTQVNVPKADATVIKNVSKSLIPDSDLAPEGRDVSPHVTIKMGIHDETDAKVRKLLADQPPIQITLGKTGVFPVSETDGDYDVVKVDVVSPELHKLYTLIGDNVENTDTRPQYKPHLTLAYVKPGTGKKYAGNTDLEGRTITLHEITFSDRNGQQISIPLGGEKVDTPTRKSFDNSLGIPRSEMPQISRTDMPAFLAFAKEKGVEITEEHVPISRLMPTQSEYNPKQAAQLPDEALKKPLMISQDYRVLDGHNIYARISEGNTKGKGIDVRAIHLPAAEALEFLKSFPKTTYKPVEHVGTAAKLAEHQAANPVDVNASQEEKARQLMALTAANKPIVEAILAKFRDIGLTHAEGLTKHNEKDFDKIIEKANRPEVKKTKPWHDVEHIRDAFRFRAGFTTFDQIPQMVQILRDAGLELQKIDTDKFMDPGAWGWRPVAIDIRMPNGQLVEFYSSFPQMIDAQYFKSEDHPVDNHDLYEKWRDKTPDYREQHREEFDKDVTDSAAVYQRAYEAGLAAAGLDETAARASFTKAIASLGSRKDFNSSDSGSDIAPRDQTPSADLTKDSTGGSDITQATGDSSLETNANIKTSSNGSVTHKTEENAKTLSPAEKKRVAAIDKELLGFGSAMTMVSDAGGSVGEIMAEMKALREEKDAILGKAKADVPADIKAIADASPNISIVRPNTKPQTPDFAAILAKKLEDEAEKARKASGIDTNKKLKGLNDLFDLGLDTGNEEEPGQFKSVMKTAQPLDEARYAKAKPALDDALSAFEGTTPEEQVNGLVDHLMGQGVSLDKIAEMQPYIVRFLEEKYLQSNENQSISEVEAQNDLNGTKSGTDGRDSNGNESTGDVQRTEPGEVAETSVSGEGESGTGDNVNVTKPGDAPSGDVEGSGNGPNAGSVSVGTRGQGDSDSTSNRVPERRDYIAPAGSLTREGSWKTAAKNNLDAIELVKKIESENRVATPEEQQTLVKFVGWGASELANNIFIDPESYKAKSTPEWNPLRERLNQVMTPEEIKTAQRSTQYAHYTSEKVIRGIWSAIEQFGFAKGSILEPGMGTGLFAVAAPKSLISNSGYTGIEMDAMTARIAKLLLPDQAVIENDYIKQKLPLNHFDVAIGNPPFADINILADPKYKKHRFLLHDYFFAKTLDSVRPGGLLAFVTSKGTMDKIDAKAREYMASQADLLGAIRLPQTAFKQNAGTEVVTDVLFFRKRMAGEEPGGESWLGHTEITGKNDSGEDVTGLVNEYYAKHPEMVLGEHAFTGSMYHAESYTVTPKPGDIEEHFLEAVKNLPKAVFAKQGRSQEIADATRKEDWSPAAKKEGSLYIHDDGTLMVRDAGRGVNLTSTKALSTKEVNWLKDYVGLRQALKQAQYDQLNAEKENTDWESSLAQLNKAYDAFVKKHGNILAFTERERIKKDEDGNEISTITRTFKNEKLLSNDVESPLVWTLEKITDDGDIIKSNWLKERQIKPPEPPKIETIQDALMVSLDTLGKLNIPHIADLMNPIKPTTEANVINELGDLIYEEPGGDWVMADEYLSGNVKAKLEVAEAAASDERYHRNVEALREVQPLPLPAEKISVQIGASWVPAETVSQFATEVLGVKGVSEQHPTEYWRTVTTPAVTYDPILGKWTVPEAHGKGSQSKRNAANEWGTADRSPAEILEAALNSESVTIMATEPGPPRRTYADKDAMAAVQAKIEKMNQAFKPWMFSDADRGKAMVDLYNEKMNVLADRSFDGRHLSMPGLSVTFKLHNHVKRAIWRIVQTGNTYLAHAVGAGKTLEMIASAMEQKRLGLISKPMFIVPNQVLKQFASEFLQAYPLANIMVADEQNFHTDNRKRFVAQAALNDLDGIIITHSAFGLLRTTDESSRAVLNDLLSEMQDAMDALTTGTDNHGNPVGGTLQDTSTIKRIQNRMEKIEQKFFGRMNTDRDNVLDFEELGVDFLYVDEAHEFRKLDFTTNQTNLKGVDPSGSLKALDLLVKSRWLDKQRPGRSMVLASGTPITNTMAELFSIQRFLGHRALIEDGLDHFDSWAKLFGEVEENIEANAAGGYKAVKRFAHFVNTGVLMQRVRAFMDVITLSQLQDLIKVPKVKLNDQGKPAPQVVVSERTELLEEYLKNELAERIRISEAFKPSFRQKFNPDPMIAIISDGQHAAFDMRYIYPESPNDPNSKLNRMIDGIIDSYHKYNDIEYTNPATGEPYPIKGAAHIVFSFGGFGDQVMANRGFNSRAWMRRRLIEGGIPADEIAFIWDYKSSTAKEGLFKEVREGKKKVMIGSPQNMGTGVNAQTRLKTLHYGMAPWFPAHVEQPHGRIIRHGNQNSEVELYWYAAKGTYDEAQWGMIARKSKAIEDALTGQYDGDIEDVSESSQYAMASALASGDPRAMRYAELRGTVEKYNRLEQNYYSTLNALQGELRKLNGTFWGSIAYDEGQVKEYADANALVPVDHVSKENFEIKIGKDTYNKDSDKNNAEIGTMLKDAWKAAITKNKARIIASGSRGVQSEIATVLGKFPVNIITWERMGGQIVTRATVIIGGVDAYLVDHEVKIDQIDDISESGLVTRIYNAFNGLGDKKGLIEKQVKERKARRDEVRKAIDQPFEFEKESRDARAEMNQLGMELTGLGIGTPPPTMTASELRQVLEAYNQVKNDAGEYLQSKLQTKQFEEQPAEPHRMFKFDDKAPEDQQEKWEEIQNLPYEPMESVLDGAVMERRGDVLLPNAKSHELIRRAFEEVRIREAAVKGKKLKPGDYEDSFHGVFMDPGQVQKTVAVLREKADEAEKYNYPAEQVNTLRQHADDLEAAAAEGDGTAVVSVFDSALPEELFHQADYLGAANKSILKRHSAAATKALDASRIRSVLYQKHYSQFNEYKGLSAPMLNAIMRAEIAPFLLNSSDSDLAEYGITPDEADNYLLTWFEGYAEKNGVGSLQHFEREEINVQNFIKRVKESLTKTNGGGGQGNVSSGGQQTNVAGGETRGSPGSTTQSPSETTRNEVDGGLFNTASLPGTLREGGLDADDIEYQIFGDRAANEEADKIIKELGVDGALDLIRRTDNQDVQHAIVSFKIQRAFLNRAEELEQVDPAKAEEYRQSARTIAKEHALRAVASGRFTRAAQLVQQSIEHILYTAENLAAEYDRTLQPDQWERIEALGKELEATNAEMEALAKQNTAQKRRIKRLEDEVAGIRKKRRSRSGQANRQATLSAVEAVQQSRQEALMEKLRAKLGKSEASESTEEPRQLKSVLKTDNTLDQETVDELAEVGAMMLMRGIVGEEEYLPHDFQAEMVAEFTDVIMPQFQQIYRKAWDIRDKWLNDLRRQNNVEEVTSEFGEDLDDWEIAEILGQKQARAKQRRAVEKWHQAMAGGKNARRDLDDYKRIINGLTDDPEIAFGAVLHAENTIPEVFYAELRKIGVTGANRQRDIFREGKAVFEKAKVERQIERDKIANELLAAKSAQQTISDLRWKARQRNRHAQNAIADELRRIKQGTLTYYGHQALSVTHAMRTLMASVDLSGAMRQGGFFMFSKPEAQAAAWVNMIKSVSEKGYGRVITEIEANALFTMAQRSGVDFAMAGRTEDYHNLQGEELFKGEQMIAKIPGIGPLIDQLAIAPSERTYTSVLDTQRMIMFDIFAKELLGHGLTFDRNANEFKKIADFINVATGRGTVPKGKFGQLILDLPFFAPRYTLSRFQLLNMTLNPVAYYNMPPRARKIIAKQAARFYGTTAAVFALAALAGASINWDPDDDDFLKIKIGNTKFDIFVGVLPIAKAIIKIVHSAIRTKGGTANRLPGEIFLDALYAAGRLARGKLSPLFSLGVDYGLGEDYVGNEFSWPKALVSRVTPLMMGDMYEAYKLDGWTGAARNFVPGMVGLGISTYKSRPERPETEAEKLASKMVAWGIPDNGPDTPERKAQKDLAADLKARSRKGEDVKQEADAALAAGKITERQRTTIDQASKKTLLVDSAEGLPLTEQRPYFLKVWEIASPKEKKELEPLFAMKMKDLEKKGNLSPEFRKRLEAAGGRIAGDVPMPDMVRQAFKKFDIPVPDVGQKLVLTKKADATDLDMSEYEKYRRATLQRIYDQAENVMKSDEYKNADADRQQDMLEKIINRSRAIERKQTKHELRSAVQPKP